MQVFGIFKWILQNQKLAVLKIDFGAISFEYRERKKEEMKI
jgi:hypothetical protein